jgi:osmoprotectant transport system ATP-binding protein
VLLGTSGCGKTTTLRMINRLEESTSGEIWVNGKNITQQSPEILRKGIGYVLQHNGLFPHYTIEENISIVPNLLKWDKQQTRRRTFELLDKLHLPNSKYAALYPNELSGGQQQRVGLARALAADPPILLMDEPFGALDPVTRVSIRKDFSQLEEFKKKTIVLVTHDVQEAFELGDRICLMDKGSIVQNGTPAELLFKPANDFVKSFFHDQRFALELQAMTIKDIYADLPTATVTGEAKTVSNSISLWEALQIFSANDSLPTHLVADDNGGHKKQINVSSLMSAFIAYKTRASHE